MTSKNNAQNNPATTVPDSRGLVPVIHVFPGGGSHGREDTSSP